MSPVRYELWCYIPEHDILHSDSREDLKSYIALPGWGLWRRGYVSPVRYELGFISQKTIFFIVTAVETSNITTNFLCYMLALLTLCRPVSQTM
jgi:hypothetical protein